MPNDTIISIANLKKSFGDLSVLKGINLEVEKGTMLALLGPNGAGKTTTIKILSTLLPPDEGKISIAGFDVVKDAKSVRANIGLTGQYAAVDEFLTARENLHMLGRLYHLSKEDTFRRTEELLTELDLKDASDRKVKTFSGGMRRRLDLALSLISTPPILFLDEPTTGLDPRSRIRIWEIILKLLKEGTTILLTTQHLEEADKLANKIAVLDHGKIIAYGTAGELKNKVGRERLEIVVGENFDFKQAVSAVPLETFIVKPETRTISIEISDSVKDVQSVLNNMDKNGIKLDGFSLHKPTLDDVFLKLTGTAAEENK